MARTLRRTRCVKRTEKVRVLNLLGLLAQMGVRLNTTLGLDIQLVKIAHSHIHLVLQSASRVPARLEALAPC
jgi:hypothetical protein